MPLNSLPKDLVLLKALNELVQALTAKDEQDLLERVWKHLKHLYNVEEIPSEKLQDANRLKVLALLQLPPGIIQDCAKYSAIRLDLSDNQRHYLYSNCVSLFQEIITNFSDPVKLNEKIQLDEKTKAEITLFDRSLVLLIKMNEMVKGKSQLVEADIEEAKAISAAIQSYAALTPKESSDFKRQARWSKFSGVFGGVLLNAGIILALVGVGISLSGIGLVVGVPLLVTSVALLLLGGSSVAMAMEMQPSKSKHVRMKKRLGYFHKNNVEDKISLEDDSKKFTAR